MKVGITGLHLSPYWWVQPAMIKEGKTKRRLIWCSLMIIFLRHTAEKETEFSLRTHQLQLLQGLYLCIAWIQTRLCCSGGWSDLSYILLFPSLWDIQEYILWCLNLKVLLLFKKYVNFSVFLQETSSFLPLQISTQNSPTKQSYCAVRSNPLESRFSLVTSCLLSMHSFLPLPLPTFQLPLSICMLSLPAILSSFNKIWSCKEPQKKINTTTFSCPARQILMSWSVEFHWGAQGTPKASDIRVQCT